MVAEGDMCDGDGRADRPEVCWLAGAFKGRLRQEIGRRVCTASGANAAKVRGDFALPDRLCQRLDILSQGRGQGNPLSLGLTPQVAWVRLAQKGVTRMTSFKRAPNPDW